MAASSHQLVDFSFRELVDLQQLLSEKPREGKVIDHEERKAAEMEANANASNANGNGNGSDAGSEASSKQNRKSGLRKFATASSASLSEEESAKANKKAVVQTVSFPKISVGTLKLANNALESIQGLPQVLPQLFDVWAKTLTWLDISCNEISELPTDLNQMVNLKVLYTHGNAIRDLREVRKLSSLSKTLRVLTLHGNPIENHEHYRTFVLQTVPELRKLDFGTVTPQDRDRAKTMQQFYNIKKAVARKPNPPENVYTHTAPSRSPGTVMH